MERSILKIKLNYLDWVKEIIAATSVIGMFGLLLFYFPDLPDKIPAHFNAAGEVDRFDSKASIWIFPSIGLLLYLGLSGLNQFPHIFNYPVKITQENTDYQYRIATKMIRTLKAVILIFFFYTVYMTVQIGIGNQDGLQVFALPLFLFALFGTLIFYVAQSIRNRH
jgi:uncharacterized membrane protein